MKTPFRTWLLAALLPGLILPGRAANRRVLATDAGLVGDGITLNTKALQKAVDRLSAQGGGTLVFSPGTYLTGQIFLKDHVELYLDGGATLLGSTDPRDYQSLDTGDLSTPHGDDNRMALLTADRVRHVRLSGFGTIDGQGRALALAVDSLCLAGQVPGYERLLEQIRNHPEVPRRLNRGRPSERYRPKLLFFYQCEDVLVQDLHFRHSACWGLSFHRCDNLVLRRLDVLNRAYWNNDGIDMTDCRNARVEGCRIDAADDAVCLKSDDALRGCEQIVVEDCDIRSSASAVKFGTASHGGFRHITVKNLRVRDTFRSAIAIEGVDGGVVEDVLVDGIVARNTGNAIFVRLGHRSGPQPGSVKNITLRNISCTIPFGRPDEAYDVRGPIDDTFHNAYASSITGIPGHKVQDIRLENIELVYPGRASKTMGYIPLDRPELVPEQVSAYPEFSMFGETPSWAFFVRHVDGISFRNVHLILMDEDFRPAFVFDDVSGLSMEEIHYPIWKPESPVVL